jgi:hypothetical protein
MPERDSVAQALRDVLISVNEPDRNLEPSNVVDGVVKSGRIVADALAGEGTKWPSVASALIEIADAINNLAKVIERRGN